MTELVNIQAKMTEKFSAIEKVLDKMATKMNSMDGRIIKLEKTASITRKQEQEFDKKFIEVISKY